MKRIFNKRLLSFLLALLMVLEMAPLSAVHVHATEGDHTDLSIDFNYQSEFANADAALLHEANQGFTVEDGLTRTEAENLAWVQIFDGDLKREGGKFREVMESSDPDEKYIVLSQDVDLRYGSGEWEPIKVTSDKVLDLNGFSLTWWDNTNKEDGKNWQSTNIYDHYLDKYFIYIQEGATLTIIDSSAPVNGYDTGKGTGRMEAAAQVIDAYEQQLDYYTHRDLFQVNGNLVIYGGTFQAGRQKDQYKSNFTWDKLADCLGKTLDLGLSIAEYATGLDAATAAMKDVETDIANRKPAQGNTSNTGENGTSDSATQKPTGQGGTQNQTVDTPASAGSTDNSQDRAQTVGERTGTDTTNNNTNNNQTGGTAAQTGGQNQANGKGTAKEDKNSLIAAEEKKVVAAALDKDKLMDMWDKGADVVNSIGSMLGDAEGTRTTQTIWGTVAKVNTSGTLVVYSGTLQGYGASPNLRNATIEIVRQGLHDNSEDKQKNDGGRAYIFGGIVEGYSGANCFNFVRAPKATQTGAARAFLFWSEGHDVTKLEYLESSWTGDWKMGDNVAWSGTIEYPYTYDLDASETNNMEILHYENQDDFVQNSNLDPIPIDTSNVVVRGGTFRTYSELTNQGVRLPYMKEIDSTGESMTFVKFTGTSGSVNLGLESFGEDMIRDGRIQLVDVYGDGTLVLMDETVDEAHPAGLKHYRLYCGDTELRHIRYLDVYPMNAGANSTHSFSLQTYYGQTNLSNISTWNTENDEENLHTAPFAGDEYFFDYEFDARDARDYYVMPNLGGEIYDTSMQDSEAWYYPEPVDSKGNPIPNFASTIAMASFTYTGDDYAAGTYQALTHGMKDLYIFQDGDYDDFSTAVYKAYTTDSYRENIKWFRYRVYRVDPITRENISESDTFGVDEPLAEVVYGVAEDDAMRCKLDLYDLSQYLIEKTKDSDEPWTGYKQGELYRIVFNVDEYVNFGYTGDALGSTNVMAFKYEEQTGDDWSIKGTHERQGESFAGHMPVASTESSVLFRCSSVSEQSELPNTDASSNIFFDTDYTPLQFGSYAVLAGEDATINFVNAKVSQADNTGDDFISVYYQWYVSDDAIVDRDASDPTKVTDTLLAGMTNINMDWNTSSDHRPEKWNPDADEWDYRNTLSPDDPHYEEYGEDGLPDNPEYWTMYDLHAYTTELRQNELCMKPGYTGNLSMQNNNPFAFNTDSCYIPEEIAGKYVYVRAIVTNLKDEYTKIYDKKQVFYSHPMLVIDPSMLIPETQEPAMDFASVSLKGEYLSKLDWKTLGKDAFYGFTGTALPEDMKKEGFEIRLSQKVRNERTGEILYEAANGDTINLKDIVTEQGLYEVVQTQELYYKRPYWSWEENQFKEAIIKEEFVTSRVDVFPVQISLPVSYHASYSVSTKYFDVGDELTFTAYVPTEALPEGMSYWYKWVLFYEGQAWNDGSIVLQESDSNVLKYTVPDDTPFMIALIMHTRDADGNVSLRNNVYEPEDFFFPGEPIGYTLYLNGTAVECIEGEYNRVTCDDIYVQKGDSTEIKLVFNGGKGDIWCTVNGVDKTEGVTTRTVTVDTTEACEKEYTFRFGDDIAGKRIDFNLFVCEPLEVTEQSEKNLTVSYFFDTELWVEYVGTDAEVQFQQKVNGSWIDVEHELETINSREYCHKSRAIMVSTDKTAGTYQYRATITDRFGNSETVTWTVTRDSYTPPGIAAKGSGKVVFFENGDNANNTIFNEGDVILSHFEGGFNYDGNDVAYLRARQTAGELYGREEVQPVADYVQMHIYLYRLNSPTDSIYSTGAEKLYEATYVTFDTEDGLPADPMDLNTLAGEQLTPGYYYVQYYVRNESQGAYDAGISSDTMNYFNMGGYFQILADGEEHVHTFVSDDGYCNDEAHYKGCFCGAVGEESAHNYDGDNGYADDEMWSEITVTRNDVTYSSNIEYRWCTSSGWDCNYEQFRWRFVDSFALSAETLELAVNDSEELSPKLTFVENVGEEYIVEFPYFFQDRGTDFTKVLPGNTAVNWESSDETVAVVDENGNVTAVGEGTAVITGTTVQPDANGNHKTAQCTVTVTCGHLESISKQGIASTCQDAGYVDHYECATCGKLSLTGDFTDTVTAEDVNLPLASHVASNVFGYNEEGHFRTCKYGCGYQFGTVTAHTYNVSAADCTTAKYCTRCKYEAEAKHGHDLIYMDELPATCTDAGIAACYNCMNCGKYFYDEAGTLETTEAKLNIRALGHQWADATCTDPKTCTREGCGMTEGEALGHSWHSATCETPETCGRCGETNGSALGHTWVDATCTAPKTCSTCLQTEGDKLAHTYDPADATCTTDAICSVCNQVIVPATGHSITDYTYDENNHMGTCSVCNEVVTEPHTLGEDNICTVCGYEYVPHVHDMAHVPAVAASCTTAGNVEHWICGDCGKTFADEEGTTEIEDVTIPATGHTEVVDAAVAATCTTTGLTEGSHCSVCDTVIVAQEVIPALGHNMVDGTCTRCGYSEAVGGPQIISQPVDYVGMVGDTATFTVVAEGEGLKYQWYFYDTNLSSWQKSPGNTSATMSVEFKAYRNNQEYRCEITDSDGNTITTNVVKIVAQVVDLVIVTQPVDYVGSVNDNVSFTVEATGNGLTYQWYYSDNGGTTWVKSGTPGFATNNLLPILRDYRDGFMYYCQITDIFGNTMNSDVVSMVVKTSEVIITQQPEAVTDGVLDQLHSFQVTATGDNLEYRWEFSSDGGETWQLSWNQGYNADQLTVRLYASRSGYLYRCKITSGLKTVVYTDPVELKLQAPSATIVTQPTNVAVISGKTIAFKVEATGNNLTYTWYRSNDKGATWNQTFLSGYNTDTLSFVANTNRAALYKCKITDGSGTSVWSDNVKLQILSAELQILTQPVNVTCANGATATFTVEAQGDTLKYQWYSSADGGSTWTASYLTGYNTDTFSFTVNATRASRVYKCVVTDAGGNVVETNIVSVTIG